MKKFVFVLMASGAVVLSATSASAWQEPGHLVSNGPGRSYSCEGGGSYCSESIDPNDKSPSTGDKVRTNFPDRGVQTGTITDIRTTQDDSNPTPPANQYDIIDVATGTVIEIVLDQQASSSN